MINLYNTTNTSTSTRNGVSGLMSGLDTEALVKGMTSGVRSKIEKQMQARQTLLWQQATYRSISSKLIAFSNKYMSYASSTNAMSSSFYNSTLASANGANAGLVSVTGTSKTANSLSITNIVSTAATAGFISNKDVASSVIKTGSIDISSAGTPVNNLAGQTVNISYGGTTYDVKIDKDFAGSDADSIIAAFNDALADVELDGGSTLADKIAMGKDVDGKLTIQAADPDDDTTISLAGGSGKVLSIMGFSAGASTDSADSPITGELDTDKVVTIVKYNEAIKNEDGSYKSLTFDLNGVQKSITLSEITYGDPQSLAQSIQSAMDKAFGSDRVRVGITSDNELTFETVKSDGSGGVVEDATSTLRLAGGGSGLTGSNGLFNAEVGASNRIRTGDYIKDMNFDGALSGDTFTIKVNDKEFDFTSDMSLNTIIDTINKSDAGVKIQYLSTTNRFSVTASESGAHGRVEISDVSGNLAGVLFGTNNTIKSGQDAVIEISYDGNAPVTVTRSTNLFDIDGLNITLKQGAETQFVQNEAITFDVKSDPDKLISAIKDMVNEYNAIMDLVNGELTTKHDRSYAPLTTEQRESMSDKEIENWENAAKTGLLFGDSTLRSLASEMRFIFFNSIPGMDPMSSIGITTSSSYRDNGKIVIDEDKLRAAIDSDPDAVKDMFTRSKNTAVGADPNDAGIMYRIQDVFNKYSKTSASEKERGILITKAGLQDSYLDSESTIYKQLKSIDDMITNLKRTQKMEEDRYYNQFTALEKYISQMNSQSSWLTQQFGG